MLSVKQVIAESADADTRNLQHTWTLLGDPSIILTTVPIIEDTASPGGER